MLTKPDKKIYHLYVIMLRAVMAVFYRMKFEGLERLPQDGPAILVANHQSYLDIPLIGMALVRRKIIYRNYWVIGKATSQISAFRGLFAAAPLIVVNGTVKRADWALGQGYMITLFPEGYYTWHKYKLMRAGKPPDLPRKIGNSAAILGLKTGCPIVPLGIRGTEQCMPPYSYVPRPGTLELRVGEPFRFDPPRPEDMTDSLIAEKAQFIIRRVDELR